MFSSLLCFFFYILWSLLAVTRINSFLCLSFYSLYFHPYHLCAGAWMATDLLTSMFCACDKTSIREVVTITRQSLSFLPVTYKSQHLYRELRMPWSCHELLKDLGIWELPVSCAPLLLTKNLFVRNLTAFLLESQYMAITAQIASQITRYCI